MSGVRAARRKILVFALAALVVKLLIAATTYGTNDIAHWGDFLAGVRQAGPVGVYGFAFPANRSFYNHPPLIGYFLEFVNLVSNTGVPYRFTIRAVSSLADVGSTFLVFELLRRRISQRRAQFAAIGVAISPVLILVSGFHGNTDPIFVTFVLLSTYLLVDRRMPLAGGAAVAIAIGVKIVPMVVIPALFLFALRRGRRDAVRFVLGFAVTFAITWGPALALQFAVLRTNVFGYAGSPQSPWGISQIGHWLGDPSWVTTFAGPGRTLVVVICAVVPAIAVWRRPEVVVAAVGWSLLTFLALAPAWGIQYMVWPLAACYLIDVAWGTVYNVAAGVAMFVIYNLWSGGLPWYRAYATYLTEPFYLVVLMVSWVVLVVVLIRGIITMFPRRSAGFLMEPSGVVPAGKRRPAVGEEK